ncbi:hypothetical protein B0H19DRAFT_384334 [Mycena capillaripes]|nr:hypothetical protein B0H19DRAFT_384334 [Mycena capillaripes]
MATTTEVAGIVDEDEFELESDAADLQVTFYPPLFLQRRIWVLDILRRARIVDVLDIGCGEGDLLSVLAQPALWLAPPPASVFPDGRANNVEYKSERLIFHPRNVAGLDISTHDLAFAIQGTAPLNEEYMLGVRATRWEDLTANLWKGGLQVINEEFVRVECIVCTEVIQHLPPDILPALAATLLGIYHPERLLLSTPSYTFNERFSRPGVPRSVRLRQGYHDPTERTDRVFRHDDHKFEWTVEEFEAWCRALAEEWGYEIEELGGVGRALEDDPWGRDDALGYASLVVAFRRKDDGKYPERAERGRAVLTALGLDGEPHELLAEHVHKVHEMAGQRPTQQSVEVIGDVVKEKMKNYGEGFISLEQIWFEPDMSTLCGGWIEVLIWAMEECEGLTLLKGVDHSHEWSITLGDGVNEQL